jgi:hypothetical protein
MGKVKCGEDDRGEGGLTAAGGRWRMFKAVCSAKAGLWLASGINGRTTPHRRLPSLLFPAERRETSSYCKTAHELVAFLFPLTVTDDLMHPTVTTGGISLQLPVWNALPCLANGLVLTSVTL